MTNIVKLSYFNILHHRLNVENNLIQVLLGPRQVGKTTTILKLIDEHFKESSIYISTDHVFNADPGWIRMHWMEAINQEKVLVIDEVQKSFNWAESIKALYDESKRAKKKIKCILLGSNSLQIQKGLTESLTGRFQLIRAYHWNYGESRDGYGLNFDEFLKYGGYPGSYGLIGSKDWVDYVRNSILSSVIERDILQYNTVKNPALFKRALEILLSYPAQEISYTKLLGQLQNRGNVEIVKYYISLYEGAFLIKALEKFSNKVVKTKSSSPKILPLAPCLPYLQIRGDYSTAEEGRILELLVGAQLVRSGEDLYYWRDGNYEVDFVLKVGRKIYGIEVKCGRKRLANGLERFKKHFPHAKVAYITREQYQEFEREPLIFIERNSN